MELNLNNIQTGDDGRVSFSGLTSGIDFSGVVESVIAAKRLPIDRLETTVTENTDKITALTEFRGLLNGLSDSLDRLYGAVTIDNTKNIFEAKQAFASSSRTDGGAASAPTNLVGVSVSPSAAVGSHSIEVVQTARQHRVASGLMTSTTTDLGTAAGKAANSVSGTVNIGGTDISVTTTDTLITLTEKINAANSGSSATGVSATIVQAGTNEHYLVLTVDATGSTLGTDIALADADSVLEDIGVLVSGGAFGNELQTARKAQFYADGLLDSSQYASAAQSSQTTALGVAGTLTFTNSAGTTLGTVNYTGTDTLQDIRDSINGTAGLTGANISASITTDGSTFTLSLTDSDGDIVNIADSSTLVADIGLAKQPLLIERSSNTITDLFDGVTLSLFQAEAGTTVNIDVERDLGLVKTELTNLVTAYNSVRQYLNTQLDPDPSTGEPREDSVLFGNAALTEIERSLSQMIGGGADGTASAFSVLAQVGIEFVNNNSLTDSTLEDTLEISDSVMDEALLENIDDVRKLFQFDFSSSNSELTLLSFSGDTTYSASGYQLDIDYDEIGGSITSANTNDGLAAVSGQEITINSGGAKGLKLFYSGDSDVTAAQFDFTVGIGAKLFFDLDQILDETSGTLQTEIDNLTDNNTLQEDRIEEMLVRLELQRESLLARYIAMETALASLETVRQSITSITDSLNADN